MTAHKKRYYNKLPLLLFFKRNSSHPVVVLTSHQDFFFAFNLNFWFEFFFRRLPVITFYSNKELVLLILLYSLVKISFWCYEVSNMQSIRVFDEILLMAENCINC